MTKYIVIGSFAAMMVAAIVGVYNANAQMVPGMSGKMTPIKLTSFCADAAYLKAIARKVHGKVITHAGIIEETKHRKQAMVELHQNIEGDEFSIMIRIGANRCIVFDGKSWTKVEPEPLGEPG